MGRIQVNWNFHFPTESLVSGTLGYLRLAKDPPTLQTYTPLHLPLPTRSSGAATIPFFLTVADTVTKSVLRI